MLWVIGVAGEVAVEPVVGGVVADEDGEGGGVVWRDVQEKVREAESDLCPAPGLSDLIT